MGHTYQDIANAQLTHSAIDDDIAKTLIHPIVATSERFHNIALLGIHHPLMTNAAADKGQVVQVIGDLVCDQKNHMSVCAEYHQLPFPQESLDALIVHHIHMLNLNLEDLLSTLIPHLKPGGLFLMSTFIHEPTTFHDFPALHAIGDALNQHNIPSPIVERHGMQYHFKNSTPHPYFLAMGLETSFEQNASVSWAIAHGWKRRPQVTMPRSRT